MIGRQTIPLDRVIGELRRGGNISPAVADALEAGVEPAEILAILDEVDDEPAGTA